MVEDQKEDNQNDLIENLSPSYFISPNLDLLLSRGALTLHKESEDDVSTTM